jgi:hypothetical protein
MRTILLIISGLVILWLVIEAALLSARLEGFREAQQQVNNGSYGNGTGYGWLKVFAVIGLLTVCGLCFYVGLAVSAGAK